MVKIAIVVLLVAAVAAAVQIGYVAPAASSYIYRSDNGGPASLIQLGPQPSFAPLPLVEPIKAFEAYDLAPVPLPYVAAKPILLEDSDDDDDEDDEESSEQGGKFIELGHGHGFEKGAGSDYGEEHHSAHGEKGSKGYNSKGHHANGESGHYGKGHKEGFLSEAKGEKGAYHDVADAYGKHHSSGKSYKGGDHGHKKHFSKGEDVTGYHKVFHKDEFKKDHDFYDIADKSGHFNKHGYEKAQHEAEAGAHKKEGHHDSALDKGEFGKEGFVASGNIDDVDHGHSAEEGGESHYSNEEEFGKKGAGSQEKEYLYGDDDDEDDEY